MINKPLVFFLDVDNTLLDNDHIKREIKRALVKVLGKKDAEHFWKHNDSFRDREKLVNFPAVIEEFCREREKDAATCDLRLGQIFNMIEFTHALYPEVKEVIAHLKTLGKVVIFTEGDAKYQKMKVDKSGLTVVADQVFIFKHKLDHLIEVMAKYKNYQLVFIDDKSTSLGKIKKLYPEIIVIEVLQGHHATVDHDSHQGLRSISSISDLINLTQDSLKQNRPQKYS